MDTDAYEALADLSLSVDSIAFDRHERDTSSGFTRVTTEFVLRGGGETGRGEDVTYATEDHDALHDAGPGFLDDLRGEWTFDGFSGALGGRELFPDGPDEERFRHYRRWGLESAALDLALRQAGTDLASALGRDDDPVRFVVSTRLGEAGFDRIDRLLDIDPEAEFKLDPTPEWDDALVSRLADTGRVRILDLKSQYTEGDHAGEADPDLYERVIEGLPDAVIEDPAFTDETRPVIAGHEERVSWDVPITGVESIEALPFEPSWLNVKPSRFGSIRSLFASLAYCDERGVDLYGGGQFELGAGRGQIQALASLFYPDGPNDVAPGGYNDPDPAPDLPTSPLAPPADPVGFRW